MAANGVRRTIQFTSTSARTILTRPTTSKTSPFASKPAKLNGLSSSSSNSSSSRFLPRMPVELGAAVSLMPLHDVTATALYTSLLSLHNRNWGCLSEGFATPL